MAILRQSACLVVSPITVYSYAFLNKLHGGPGLRFNDDADVKLSLVGWCLSKAVSIVGQQL